jgi:hypothetical protein
MKMHHAKDLGKKFLIAALAFTMTWPLEPLIWEHTPLLVIGKAFEGGEHEDTTVHGDDELSRAPHTPSYGEETTGAGAGPSPVFDTCTRRPVASGARGIRLYACTHHGHHRHGGLRPTSSHLHDPALAAE